ncbi:response regulator transcription factor [Chthonobacter albigriseus]|uniref:response regulator transcription factor n=1 Tax=Chthonobacter albigriseus TaxID=1683161 RepID=UPI0015EF1B1F|nr:response regulator transcription factor [Chthonobacter albigriseus]
MRILLVEDSQRLTGLLVERIHDAGWRVDVFSTIADARTALREGSHDLLLLDLGLPDGDGTDLIRALRAAGSAVPILVISARAGIEQRVAVLDAGADDFLLKPFNHAEFLARCRAMLRRAPSTAQPILSAGQIRYDPATTLVTMAGQSVAMPPRERALLELLLRDAGRVVLKRRLEAALSEYDEAVSANALELSVSRLRKRLETQAADIRIDTIRGVGYMLRTIGSP